MNWASGPPHAGGLASPYIVGGKLQRLQHRYGLKPLSTGCLLPSPPLTLNGLIVCLERAPGRDFRVLSGDDTLWACLAARHYRHSVCSHLHVALSL